MSFRKYNYENVRVEQQACHNCDISLRLDLLRREVYKLESAVKDKFPALPDEIDPTPRTSIKRENRPLPVPNSPNHAPQAKSYDEAQIEFIVKLLGDVKLFLNTQFGEGCLEKEENVKRIDSAIRSIRGTN